ncbi:ribosomal protein S18-alanine N-acetyltransferase [Phytoactinopolyspora halotolerans]|nr:ribosomal protein S18-alanine N-acetyltransferase [Phytoactinopolyspora halotolerans]
MRSVDVEALLPVERLLFAGDPPWTEAQFHDELARMPETRWYIVAELATTQTERRIVGYAGLRAPGIPGEPADIQTIAVTPEHQRRGIGSVLMDALIREAHARQADSIMLEVRSDNDAAIAFYTEYGFERIAVRRGYYGGGRDGLVMRKSLP